MKKLFYILMIFGLCAQINAQTITDIVVGSEDHNTLEAAVIAADLAGTLSGPGPFTVFAPTDDAFASLPDGVLDGLLEDTQALTDVLLYHVVSGEIASTSLMDGQTATTVGGQDISVAIFGSDVFINGISKVIVADIPASNGIVHVVDVVLSPSQITPNTITDIVVNSPDHNTLEAAVIAADLAGALSGEGPFTVFAPTDAAFAALPDGVLDGLLEDTEALTNVLLYHAIAGEVPSSALSDGQVATTINGEDVTVSINADGIFINDAKVTVADIPADNGIVHVIDAVLVPGAPASNTITDIVVNSEVHNTLEAAVIAADLAGTLSGEGPFTVFAPTDAAFEALPEGVLDGLLEDTEALTNVLLYHVIAGEVPSTALSNGQIATTVNGADVTVTINDDGVFINDAKVTIADLPADNGIVHVIDAVLIPPTPASNTITDIVVNSEVHNTLEAAVIAADLAGTLSGEGPFTVFAPTDAAFEALPEGVLDGLLEDIDALTDVLLYHVISGEVPSTALSDGQVATTVNGADVVVTINDDGVFINDAKVSIADIEADNGIVHVIDAVLVPEVSSGLNLLPSQNLSVYPVPANSELNLIIPPVSEDNNWQVNLYNSFGQMVQTQQMSDGKLRIDVSEMPRGVYILHLENSIYQLRKTVLFR